MRENPPRAPSCLFRRVSFALPFAFATALWACGAGSDRAYEGRSARAWAAQLSDSSIEQRVAAAEALYHIAPRADDIVTALVDAMRDSSGAVQTAVAIALSTVGARTVPGLIDALRDDHISVRLIALSLLAERGADASPATSAIGQMLLDANDEVRLAAAQTLRRIGPAARDAEPQLLGAAARGTTAVRIAALEALVANDAEPVKLRPLLEAALRDSVSLVRSAAVTSAAQARLAPREAMMLILPRTTDRDDGVRRAAFRALGSLVGAPTVGARARKVLADAATDPDSVVRAIALRALIPAAPGDIDREPRRPGAFITIPSSPSRR